MIVDQSFPPSAPSGLGVTSASSFAFLLFWTSCSTTTPAGMRMLTTTRLKLRKLSDRNSLDRSTYMASTFCVSETVVSAGSKLRVHVACSIITHAIVQVEHDGDVEGDQDGRVRDDLAAQHRVQVSLRLWSAGCTQSRFSVGTLTSCC